MDKSKLLSQKKYKSFFKKTVKKSVKGSWFYIFISRPDFYFFKLFKHSLIIGVVSFILSIFASFIGITGGIPVTLHGLVGTVIGLLLVFRTNSAYDRWWEGTKNLASISDDLNFFIIRLSVSIKSKSDAKVEMYNIKKNLKEFIYNLKIYLQTENKKSEHSNKAFLDNIYNILNNLKNLQNDNLLSEKDAHNLEQSIKEILENADNCKRIKNTPIPLSYALHIKISMFIYLLTLPFGLFHDMGLYSCGIVMILYYIIGGIELISNEIENPFRGDPNDIPLDVVIKEMDNLIDYNFKKKNESLPKHSLLE